MIPETATIRLFGYDRNWALCGTIVRSHLFGEMVHTTAHIIQSCHFDLYYDAHWLDANVNGPTEFDWLVRAAGTKIGEAARPAMLAGAGKWARLYRVALAETDGEWFVTFTTVPLQEITSASGPATSSND